MYTRFILHYFSFLELAQNMVQIWREKFIAKVLQMTLIPLLLTLTVLSMLWLFVMEGQRMSLLSFGFSGHHLQSAATASQAA